jgi:adenine-specific DNA-methyltransferase
MTIKETELISSINKAYRLVKPKRIDLDGFKANLLKLISLIDIKESEENVKIHLMDFLKNTFYNPNYLIATKGKTDFVIHLGKEASSFAGVLFEVKKPTNITDMITKSDFNKKAMHELILYFLRERLNNKNNSLTHLIITNVYEWYIFDAAIFERIFVENSHLQKAYKEWEGGQKVSTKTDLFYNEIAKPFLLAFDKKFDFTYFDIRNYESFLKGDKEKHDKKLIPLYKFFTPSHLLKLPFLNDSNSLDKGFFSELLHIIGLEEVKDGSRKIIRRLNIGKRHPGSILENTINILEVESTLRKIPSHLLSGETEDERLFNLALELSITWVNRILFLKLLEAQLLKYHSGKSAYKFLNIHTIKDYDELYKLFFQVLAKQHNQRTAQVQKKYSHIPYLNSSLFEISDLEDFTMKINGLDDNLDLDIYQDSILKKSLSRKDSLTINTLHYFFEFLDAYDFASVGKEEVQEENKTIINAAVLGLVFEKINGYKDGSIYTPGAVTMFLCRESIRKAVVRKFNDTYNWHCETIDDIKNYLQDKRKAKDILVFNQLIESIRIVDPAVGSGHFLVSALNEIILIKSELGVLSDELGNRLSDINVSIDNDELIITDGISLDFFEYIVSENVNAEFNIAPKTQNIQQTLFNEKRKIIEGCLFGVDINPNSVKICQLRLWIELLKHAYYKPESNYKELETLPNIDINIKQGNSLLSKFSLEEDLSEVFKKQKFSVKDYQTAVKKYKDAPNKDAKIELLQFFKNIKEQFKDTVSRKDPKRKRLSDLRGQMVLVQTNFDLFGQKRSEKDLEAEVNKIGNDIKSLENQIKEIENNVIYRSAFEWRFEFPEVLNEKGEFEGFEVIIGNPPYIQLQKMGESTDILETCNYESFTRTGDIYCLFYELAVRLLKQNYYFGFITSNKWMRANYGVSLRKFFLEKTNPLLLVDFGGYQVFESATVDTNLLISQKAIYEHQTQTCLVDKSISSLEKMSDFIRQYTIAKKDLSTDAGWVILNHLEAGIKIKIEKSGIPLKNWNVQINYGIKTGYNDAFIINGKKRDEIIEKCPKAAEIIRPILKGRDIKKYRAQFEDRFLIFTRRGIDIDLYPAVKDYLLKYYELLKPKSGDDKIGRKSGSYKWYEIQDNIAYFLEFDKEKIIWIELSDSPKFSYDDEKFLAEATAFIMTGSHLKYLTAFFNSQLCDWYFDKITTTSGVGTNRWKKIYIENLAIPEIDFEKEKQFEKIIDNLLSNKTTINIPDSVLDTMILDLYNFIPEEKDLLMNFRK